MPNGSDARTGRWSPGTIRLTIVLVVLAAFVVIGAALTSGGSKQSQKPFAMLANNPFLDPGTTLTGPAPDFTLTDQFGKRVSLSSFRGKVVILAFNDSECTTICPLTTTAMMDAKELLGPAGSQVQLLGVDANPTATSIADVRAYSEVHGMVHEWYFLTGSLAQLKRVWNAYKIQVAIERGQIDHTPALFMIDAQGRLSRLYLTQQSYAAVPQLGHLLAQDASKLLPDQPAVSSHLSYSQITGIPATAKIYVPRAGGGTEPLGPSPQPRLYLFFATWDQQVTDLARQLDALNAYQSAAARGGLPSLTAIDEASVEPSPRALRGFLSKLRRPLSYPVGVDPSGRIGDGYEIQDEPWLVLISPSGQILWYYDVSTVGWPTRAYLEHQVRNALAHIARGPVTETAVQAELAGSPAPLAQIHAQANQLLGGEPALAARIRSLRSYPIVLNVWGSWCGPCRAEFGLLASAAARYGRQVAFIGADVNDNSGDARAFLEQHPVTYPSYQMPSDQLAGIVPQGISDTPTTVYFSATGTIVNVHTGQYDTQGSLDGDVQTYVLGG
jgi:cytochrome oxidase Cu insertion factor (SCO1/SenC/PrrC family)/thiol-disulfide isomerase/thioredoxin